MNYPKPREGTETYCIIYNYQCSNVLVELPQAPRGDGNDEVLDAFALVVIVLNYPKPREGTETHHRIASPP